MTCSINKSQLIRAGCIEFKVGLLGLLIFLFLCDHCVADAKTLNEFFYINMILLVGVVQVFKEQIVLKVNVGHSRSVILVFRISASVRDFCNSHALKIHNVFCERAGFVREDIMDHSKFLIKVAGLAAGRLVFLLIINHPVPADVDSLSKLDHLESDQKTDGNEIHQGKEPGSKVKSCFCRN